LLLIDSEVLLARISALVILDEAQMIKNPGAKVSQMAVLCAGVPVMSERYRSRTTWASCGRCSISCNRTAGRRALQRIIVRPLRERRPWTLGGVSARLAPFLLRRTKDAVARNLPPKVEIVESITLDEKQRDFYDVSDSQCISAYRKSCGSRDWHEPDHHMTPC